MNARIAIIFISILVVIVSSMPLTAQVAWVARFDDALKQAKAEQKLIIVDVSASWCPPCQQMAREVHTNKEFIEFTKTQVFMLLDAEKDNDGIRLAGKFDVRSYPTILVLDAQGREINRLIGGSGAVALIRDLKEIIADPIRQITGGCFGIPVCQQRPGKAGEIRRCCRRPPSHSSDLHLEDVGFPGDERVKDGGEED